MATTNVSIRMDSDLKAQADALFAELGMNLSTAFNIFVRQSLREGGIPFEIRTERPNKETVAAMLEAEHIAADPKAKKYRDLDELFADLDARVIHRAIPLVKTINIYISVRMMKILTNFMVCDDHGRKRRILGKLLRLGGESIGSVIEHFMTAEAVEQAKAPMPELERLYREAVPEAVEYLGGRQRNIMEPTRRNGNS